jgi:predicted nucleotidyltransferase
MTANLYTKSMITPYPDINEILLYILSGIDNILCKNLIGLYLFGSLTYGDFNPDSSDIDLVTIINKPLSHRELEQIKQLHKQFKEYYQKWGDRLECSYTPVDMLINILPPKEPRPYFGGGVFYDEAPYGNEWIINNYLLYEHGISLIGPDFKELAKPINIIEVQKACIQDLFQEWEPKITDFEWLDNSYYQSYLVMNLCRILYTVICGKTGTKRVSAEWVRNKFGLQWSNLIETAANWKYGKKMSLKNETIYFIKFTIDIIKQNDLFKQMSAKD